ncbi:MAG: acetate kinase, partial [Shimia sp.]|nr:acetate kinase [Shimia sp.]
AEIDNAANAANRTRITCEGSRLAAHVIPTDEEGIIAGETRRLTTT